MFKVTEILYVHSKLMIVDDEVVIMGSGICALSIFFLWWNICSCSVIEKNICVCLLSLEFFYWFYMYSFLYLTLTWYFSLLFTANINDRSMLGDRDSELAVCVQDVKKTVSSFYHQFFFSWIIRKKYVEG